MKAMILVIFGLISASAKAGTFGYSGKTTCVGVVSTLNSSTTPITLEIEWGEVEADPASLPPYSIDQKQDALITIDVDGHSGSESAIFKQKGGTTRCEWWSQAKGMIVLEGGLYSYYLEFDDSWNHSGCGSYPNGVFLSDTIPNGPNQMVKMSCQQNHIPLECPSGQKPGHCPSRNCGSCI